MKVGQIYIYLRTNYVVTKIFKNKYYASFQDSDDNYDYLNFEIRSNDDELISNIFVGELD